MIQDFQNFQKSFSSELNVQSYLPGNFVALNIVLPGDVITMDKGYMKFFHKNYSILIFKFSGFGTYEDNSVIYSSLVGTVEKTNKLLLVKPLSQKYQPEIGDVIIGKVTEVQIICLIANQKLQIANKKWHLDINAACTAFLQLNSTFIPEQRKKTEQDELKMREMFKEGELICAEVHCKDPCFQFIFHSFEQ